MNRLTPFKRRFYVLTTLFLMVGLVSNVASAEDDLRKIFSGMTAQEALMSPLFLRTFANMHIEGTSTWVHPLDLCVNYQHQVVQTTKMRRSCSVWKVDLKTPEQGSDTLEFESYRLAQRKAETENATSAPYCDEEDAVYHYWYEPINNNGENLYFRVAFYERRGATQKGDYLGAHQYKLRECIGDPFELHLTGGETSGGVTEKKKLPTSI